MATQMQNLQSRVIGNREIHLNLGQFVQEHVLRSWWLVLWLLFLTYVTVSVIVGQAESAPLLTGLIVLAWVVSVGWALINEITRQHNPATLWLRNNLYSSITNVMVTLVLVLLIIAALRGFIDWAFVKASFTTDPELAAATLAQHLNPGANWGAIGVNFRNLMVFRFPREETWRLWAIIIMLLALAIPSTVIYRERYRRSTIRKIWTVLWILSPLVTFVLLRGYGDENSLIPKLNPDVVWGGLLLTLIIAVFAIAASFPIGVVLALGRRSNIRGIPAWLTYGVAAILTIGALIASTIPGLASADGFVSTILAFWPIIIPIIAYLFQSNFDGNVVALFSTIYIEVIRGVPLITILFMSIILFPILLPPDWEILGTWRVMVAAALFASAYLAENVRGGLQSLANGQYEAADAIGLNTIQKYRLIIMPQALRAVIPAIVGQFIGLFKDTTLIAIIGLIELLGVANLISAQPDWLGVRREPYVFIALLYFVGSAAMSGYSRRLESQLGVGER